jgi:orotidine-5'-phosphate decarboxylase
VTTAFVERMRRSAGRRNSRVVLALDSAEPFDIRLAHMESVLDATKGGLAAVKLNHHLLLPYGLDGLEKVISECRREDLPIIADLKLNDIESTNLNAVDSLHSYGVDAVIANPIVGFKEGLGGALERLHSWGGGLILLVYMSHGGADEGYGLRFDGGPLYKEFAQRAKRWGADGVVVSAKSPEKVAEVREIVGEDCLVFSPGVGAQGGSASAWSSSGADFMILGRSITEAVDPAKALAAFRL